MLDKEFIPYQESLELKELGFDEPCLAVHYEHKYYPYSKSRGIKNSNKISQQWICTAPTFSQAFRWFREKYELHHLDLLSLLFLEQKMNYEEAELKCLRRLIEIVKQQKLNHDLMSGDIVGY